MDEPNPIKDIVYQCIEDISEKKIQTELSKGQCKQTINEIISKCFEKIIHLEGNKAENIGKFAESLSHYFLTILLIPTQRKVSDNETEIDIVIPDLKTLKENPKDALIIYFLKTSNQSKVQEKILELSKIQPNNDNIWLVSYEIIQTDLKSYMLNEKEKSFVKMIDDIKEFTESKKSSKLKIFRN